MNTNPRHLQAKTYPALESIGAPVVGTEQAAYYLNRRGQTLRGWACRGDGPIQPRNINGRLGWPVADLKRLLGVSA